MQYKSAAIIGMSCNIANIGGYEELWEKLVSGEDIIRDFPESRKSELKSVLGGNLKYSFVPGAYMDRITYFEPEYFSISSEESRYIDPQQRILLELVEGAFQDAGYNVETLDDRNVGVYIGNSTNQYKMLFSGSNPLELVNSLEGVNAARVAYTFDLHGPTYTLDTACSSTLVALNQAVRDLSCDCVKNAIVGGVQLSILPNKSNDNAESLSSVVNSKTCATKAFDRFADGFMSGEGGVVLLLKNLEDAIKDKDNIYAIIRGCAINSNGRRSNGIAAPSDLAQTAVIKEAIGVAGIDAQSISFIETHGTGTVMGDPIELSGISDAFSSYGVLPQTIGIGSVKTNIGHTGSVSGLAGVVKVILMMKHKQLIPTLHFDEPNYFCDIEKSPVYINVDNCYWDAEIRRAGVSSFGLTGTNAHAILEETQERIDDMVSYNEKELIVISANSIKSLNSYLVKLRDYFLKHNNLLIHDVAYTLNTGRRDLEYKFIVKAGSLQELLEKIDEAIKNENGFIKVDRNSEIKAALIIQNIADYECNEDSIEPYERIMIEEYDKITDSTIISSKIKRYLLDILYYFKRLKEYSVPIKTVIGIQSGEILSDYIKGNISLETLIDKLSKYKEMEKKLVNRERFENLFRKLVSNKYNVFAFVMPDRIFSDIINETLKNNDKVDNGYILYSYEQLLSAIEKLISKGHRVAWKDQILDKNQKRIPLPTYQYDRRSLFVSSVNTNFLPDYINKIEESNKIINIETDNLSSKLFEMISDIATVHIFKNNHIYEIGVNSLDIMQLIARIQKQYQVLVSISTFYEGYTIEEICNFIEGMILEKVLKVNDREEIPKAEKKEFYPMSSEQRRLFIINELDNSNLAYNMPVAIEVTGGLDALKVQDVLRKLTNMHEVFRTSFHNEEGNLVQRISDDIVIDFEYKEIQNESEFEIQKFMNDFIRPFDLSKAPLLKVYVVKLSNKRNIIMFDMHHIISDGSSVKIFVNEFWMLYNNMQVSKPVVQYKDYSEWMLSRNLSNQRQYWLDVYRDEVPVLNLPTDFKRTQIQSFTGENIKGFINEDIKEGVLLLAKETSCTEYMILLSAFMILLGKYCRQEDIVVGTPISGRTHRDIENTMGMFTNTLALRGKPEGRKSYVEFLYEVKKDCLNAYENQEYPFDELVQELGLKREVLSNPLFNVMFVFQNIRNNEHYNVPDNTFKSIEISKNTAQFDLNIEIYAQELGYRMNFTYSTELFRTESIVRMMEHYRILLKDIISGSKKNIEDISFLTEADKIIINNGFDNLNVKYPMDKTIVDLFEKQVKMSPDNIAVVYEDKQLTYDKLNCKANQVANQIRKLGVKPNDFVAIMCEPSIEMIVAIYAVIKSGGAYINIDTTYPKERVEYLLRDSGAKVLLVGHTNVPQNVNIHVINLNDEVAYTGSGLNLTKVNKPDDLLYVIYTSGTTGNPKGVMITHKNVVRLFKNDAFQFNFNEHDIWTMFHSYCFDFSVWEMYGATLFGGELVVLSRETVKDSFAVLETIRKNQVTVLNQVPSAFYNLMREDNQRNGSDMKTVRYLIFGGEALEPVRLTEWKGRHSGTKIINMYGITEITVHATYKEIEDKEMNEGISNIGVAIPTLAVCIMNGMNLCGVGIQGELCIVGEGVAKGYLHRDELSAKKFIDNPYGRGKLYRSGDLARYMPDGNIEYLGRIDEQVKIRGYRIELGEIENSLRKINGIDDAVVIACDEKNGEKYICAYIVADEVINIGELKEELRKLLPEYMIPAYILQIETIKLTKNGKADRKNLPKIEKVGLTEYVAPRNELETKLVGIFEEILDRTNIGIKDSFFDIGGHSLRATKVVNRIESMLGIRLPLKEMFLNPTVEGLSQVIRNGANEVEEYRSIPKAEEKEYYSMSAAQRRLYVINEIDDVGIAYNMPIVIDVKGEFKIDKIRNVFQLLVNRHEALRTSFYVISGEPVQKIAPTIEVHVEYEDQVRDDINDKFNEFIRPFDLSKAPLMRIKAVRFENGNNVIFFDMHHIISDGMSMDILVDEFSTLYNSGELEEIAVQYKDYSEWMKTRDISNQKEYWLNEFSGSVPVLNLPLDYIRPNIQSFNGKTVSAVLDISLKQKIEDLCKQMGTTDYMIFLSVFMIMLSQYGHQEEIVVGSPISGRTHKDTEKMLGIFINSLAIKGNVQGDKSFKQFLYEIKEKCLKSYENQEYPFDELVETLDIKREISRNPLFDVSLVLQNNENKKLEMGSLQLSNISQDTNISKLDLTLNITIEDKTYGLHFEYCSDLFKEDSIKAMIQHYQNLMFSILDNPNVQIKDMNMFHEDELTKVMQQFNDTKKDYPKNKTVDALFEEWVAKRPDSVAIVSGDNVLTYEKFNKRVNKLAHTLRNLDVHNNDYVAILSQRTIETLVGIYSILKVGAAYVPIDTSYPFDRIEYILRDSEAKIILVDSSVDVQSYSKYRCINIEEEVNYSPDDSNLSIIHNSNDIAYMIYTSGTTGNPKGVEIRHKSLTNIILDLQDRYPMVEGSAYLFKTSYCFDVSLTEIFGWFFNGGKLIILEKDSEKDPDIIANEIMKNNITHINFVPSMLSMFVSVAKKEKLSISTVDYVFVAGEAIGNEVARSCKEIFKTARLVNLYGPTEATIYSTYYEIDKINNDCVIPIGKPLSNVKTYIINNENRPCGIGIPGELCIAGNGIALDYKNQEDLTSAKFINNPWNPDEILYKTGDLARWIANGNIEYMGRIDAQVKVRGFRVELGEIESVMRNIEYVSDAAVIVKENGLGDKSICAYFVSDEQIKISDIRNDMNKQLPDYMMPTYFMQIEYIPVTKNGKLDHKMLPAIELKREEDYVAPSNGVEMKLLEIAEDILGVKGLSIKDNFFSVGGDSIKAIRIISKMRDEGYMLSVKDIMKSNCFKDIAYNIKDTSHICQCSQEEVNGDIPLTPIQKEFYSWNFPKHNYFNQAVMLKNPEGFDVEYVKMVMNALMKHHDELRAVFPNGNQTILSVEEISMYDLNVYDLRQIDDEEQLNATVLQKASIIQDSIDIENGPLIKLGLFQMKTAQHLMICMHHLIVDGVSWRILLEDFSNAYRDCTSNKDIVFPKKTSSYRKWAEGLIEYSKSNVLKEEIPYWKSVYNKIQTGKFNGDINLIDHKYYGHLSMKLDNETTKSLLYKTEEAFGTNVNDLLLTALGLAVYRLTNQKSLAVNLEGHGREEIHVPIDINRTVGWFTSIYPIVLNVDESIENMVINTKDVLHKVPNNGIGYSILKYTNDLEINEQADICFNYLGQIDNESGVKGQITFSEFSTGITTAKENGSYSNIEINALIVNDLFVLNLTYCEGKYSYEMMQQLIQNYEECLRNIIIHCMEQGEVRKTVSDFEDVEMNEDQILYLNSLLDDIL